eukprot:scaffold22680_cov107-Cylindrotheca_fusiformis.AAC.1
MNPIENPSSTLDVSLGIEGKEEEQGKEEVVPFHNFWKHPDATVVNLKEKTTIAAKEESKQEEDDDKRKQAEEGSKASVTAVLLPLFKPRRKEPEFHNFWKPISTSPKKEPKRETTTEIDKENDVENVPFHNFWNHSETTNLKTRKTLTKQQITIPLQLQQQYKEYHSSKRSTSSNLRFPLSSSARKPNRRTTDSKKQNIATTTPQQQPNRSSMNNTYKTKAFQLWSQLLQQEENGG